MAQHFRNRPRPFVPRADVAHRQHARQLVPLLAAVAAHHGTADIQGNLKQVLSVWLKTQNPPRFHSDLGTWYLAILLLIEPWGAIAEGVRAGAVAAVFRVYHRIFRRS